MSSPEPHAAAHNSHGNTPAAWTAVAIMLVGVAIGTYAVIELNWTVFWVSVAIVVLGAVVGKVLQMMGLGATAEHHEPPSGAERDRSVVQAERSAHLLRGEPVERDDASPRGSQEQPETDVLGQYEGGASR